MTTRNDRRREKSKIKKKLKNPLVRKMLRAEMERESGTETYRLDDDGRGKPMFFDISSMRDWVTKNLEICSFPVDCDRAARLIESGAVDLDHIKRHTFRHDAKPIIVCRGVLDGDQIVDGSHTFVAICAGAAMYKMEINVPAYLLMPEQWRKFIIPNNVARICGFK